MIQSVAEENLILEEFRILVKDLQQDDSTLRRFLRARNHNLQNAETMLRKSVEWRKVHNVDTALTTKAQDIFLERFPIQFPGLDYKNRTVMFVPLGAWPLREFVEAGYKEQMMEHSKFCLEQVVYEINKTTEEQFTLIIDMAESTYWKFTHFETLQAMLKLFQDFEANYPERLAEAWIVNAPICVSYGWALIKTVLTGNTVSKVTHLTGNEQSYMPVLLERMPESSIPKQVRKSF